MEVCDRQNLRKHRHVLATDMVITPILNILFGENILTDFMVDRIKSKTTEYERNTELLNILPRRGPKAFRQFLNALDATDQTDLAEYISNAKTIKDESISTLGLDSNESHNHSAFITSPKQHFEASSFDLNSLPNANSTPLNINLTKDSVKNIIVPSPNSMDDIRSTTSFATLIEEADVQYRSEVQSTLIKGVDITDHPSVNDLIVRKSSVKFFEKHHMNAYNMTTQANRLALIVCVDKFDESSLLDNRQAGDVDRARLEFVLRQLGFRVYVLENGTASEIWETIQKFASLQDHAYCDCTILAVMSHGKSGGFYGRDGKLIKFENVFTLFDNENCMALQNKPKGFFFQCCRGPSPDKGIDEADGKIEQDSMPFSGDTAGHQNSVFDQNLRIKLPTKADFLIAHATVDGFAAMRNTKQGSWFIQALVRVLAFHSCDRDLVEMMTIVNDLVSKREAYSPGSQYHRCKEMSETQFSLRRKWYFYPGIYQNN